MHPDIRPRQRLLVRCWVRFVAADSAFRQAEQDAMGWFPRPQQKHIMHIGDPGSPVRRLYERRERAMLRLATARMKLETARQKTRSGATV